jgi:hypothetical protein
MQVYSESRVAAKRMRHIANIGVAVTNCPIIEEKYAKRVGSTSNTFCAICFHSSKLWMTTCIITAFWYCAKACIASKVDFLRWTL